MPDTVPTHVIENIINRVEKVVKEVLVDHFDKDVSDVAAWRKKVCETIIETARKTCAEAHAVADGYTPEGGPMPELGNAAEDDAALVAAIKRVGPAKAREIQQEYKLKADFWRENGVTLAQHLNRHATRSAHIETPEGTDTGELVIPDAVRVKLVGEFMAKADFWKSVGVDVESYVQKHGRAMALRMEYRNGKAAGRMQEFSEDTYVAANN